MKSASSHNRLFLGAATLKAGNGGIARVARMMVRSLEAEPDLQVLSLLDSHRFDVWGRPCEGVDGGQLSFALRTHLAAPLKTLHLYDSAGIARAHPRFGWRPPFVCWMHGVEVWDQLRPTRRKAMDAAKIILCNSHHTLNRFKSLHGELPHARVCWLATEDDDPPDRPPDFSGPPTVLMLSRIEAGESYKGHDAVIEAWPEIRRSVPDAQLVIAGAGSGFERVSALANASPAASSIRMTGYVPEGEVENLWRQAHIFCMPSTCEGFGLVYAEAMRFGLPVIASIHDAGCEVNAEGVSGFNVDLGAPSQLSARLSLLLANPNLKREMGAAARARWTEHFRFSSFKQRFLAELQAIEYGKHRDAKN